LARQLPALPGTADHRQKPAARPTAFVSLLGSQTLAESAYATWRLAAKGDRVGVMLVGASKEQIAAGSVLSSN